MHEPARERLRRQFKEMLRGRYLKSLDLPPDTAELLGEQVNQFWIEVARERGDSFTVESLEWLESNGRPQPVTGETAILAPAQASVEEAIAADPNYGHEIPPVFVGEYPTGEFNASVTRTADGFIICLDAGVNVLLHHVINALFSSSAPDVNDQSYRQIADMIKAYVDGANLLSFPAPPFDAMIMMVLPPVAHACVTFLIAHEYGHILAGHHEKKFKSAAPDAKMRRRERIEHNWNAEYEADAIAFDLLLGRELPTSTQESALDNCYDYYNGGYDHEAGVFKFDNVDGTLMTLMGRALEIKASYAAPMLVLGLDRVVASVRAARDGKPILFSETHPPASERQKRYAERIKAAIPAEKLGRYISHWSLAHQLLKVEDRLVADIRGS